MITAPDLSAETDTIRRDCPPGLGGESVTAPMASRPRVAWSVSDLLLVGLVVVLAVATALTASRQVEHQRALARVTKELKSAAMAFQACLRDRGVAPPDTNAGLVPPGMASYLAGINWTNPTPVGGFYRWVNVAAGESGAAASAVGMIAITAFPRCPPLTLSVADMREIDRRLDDGNLATGNFRTGFNGWPNFWVRASP